MSNTQTLVATQTPSKKRKHTSIIEVSAQGSTSTKKVKKEKKAAKYADNKEGARHCSKGKERAHEETSHKVDIIETEEFTIVKASLVISIPPIFASNPRAGVVEMLDSMVMRYIPMLKGVMLSHSNMQFLSGTATVQEDCPYARCTIGFDAMVWSPQIGMRISGKVNLCSPDHISVLVHRTFNVSIPRNHIPQDLFEFEYGPAENDPEFGAGSSAFKTALKGRSGDDDDAGWGPVGWDDETEPPETIDTQLSAESEGRWIRRMTGDKVGGKDGVVIFTVVGLTIANQMLSLIGSLQEDPFSPEHDISVDPKPTSHYAVSNAIDRVNRLQLHDSEGEGERDVIDEDDEIEDDGFAALTRKRIAAQDAVGEPKPEKKRKKAKKAKDEDAVADGSVVTPKKPKVKKPRKPKNET